MFRGHVSSGEPYRPEEFQMNDNMIHCKAGKA
jgi:hypothetical protein